MRDVMDLVVRLFLSIVFVGIPLCSDLLLRRFLGVSSLGAIPTIALYAPFFYLIKKTWQHPTPPKQEKSFNDTVFTDAKPTPIKSRRALVIIFAIVISFSFGSYLGFYFGQQSMEPALEEQYQRGYDAGDSAGYDRGFDIGHKSGHNIAYDNGYIDGYEKGYKNGAASNSFGSKNVPNPFLNVNPPSSSWDEMKEQNLSSPPHLLD